MLIRDRIFNTEKINIKQICSKDYRFVIPVYQRPYVWDEKEINKLLQDISYSCELDKDYYVGNIYVMKRSDTAQTYDVVDGQQRFTTFWLISLYFFGQSKAEIHKFVRTKKQEIRLSFDIRTKVTNYLNDLVTNIKSFDGQEIENQEFLKYIAKGIKTIKSFFDGESDTAKIDRMQRYIFEKVKFVFNEAPGNTDLNSLFTTLGNSGVQLEQSDILKARLLRKLKSESFLYSKIWEASENLENYFEKSVLEVFGPDCGTLEIGDFGKYDANVFKMSKEQSDNVEIDPKGKTISDILSATQTDAGAGQPADRGSRCKSILSFNALLIHTYRIYRLNKGQIDIDSFDIKKLLQIFHDFTKSSTEDDIKEFFQLLWRVRYVFDQYVVKWRLPNSDSAGSYEEHLLLTGVSKDKNSFLRSNKSPSNIQALQSVLYFNSGYTQQYWLTPFLNDILQQQGDITANTQLEILEGIDNYMVPGDKKISSWELCGDVNKKRKFNVSDLQGNKGTKFEHYWFYKLEYLLWKEWSDTKDPKFRNYRITSKNSVEHVLSQNDEYEECLTQEPDLLHSFGNLGLLSVGQNSSYGNQIVEKKWSDFKSRSTYDSLKLYYLYDSFNVDRRWDEQKIEAHRDQMLRIMEEHYK